MIDHSLVRFRDPEFPADVAAGLLCELTTMVRRTLIHPEMTNAAKLSAITHFFDDLAVGVPAGEAADLAVREATGKYPAELRAAAAVAGWPAVLAGILARPFATVPATAVIEALSGGRVKAAVERTERPLTMTEARDLKAEPGERAHCRKGHLTLTGTPAGGRITAADVTALLIPDRIGAQARADLGIGEAGRPMPAATSVPVGTALRMAGVRRVPDYARVTGNGTVISAATLWIDDVPVGMATEKFTPEFLASLLSGNRSPWVRSRLLSLLPRLSVRARSARHSSRHRSSARRARSTCRPHRQASRYCWLPVRRS
jgi:hypothetical protein